MENGGRVGGGGNVEGFCSSWGRGCRQREGPDLAHIPQPQAYGRPGVGVLEGRQSQTLSVFRVVLAEDAREGGQVNLRITFHLEEVGGTLHQEEFPAKSYKWRLDQRLVFQAPPFLPAAPPMGSQSEVGSLEAYTRHWC